MSRGGYHDHSSDDEIDVHIRRRHDASPARRVPAPVHYVETRPARPTSYYATGRPQHLGLEQQMVHISRSRSRERRSSPPSQAPLVPQPIIINNHMNQQNSDSDDSYLEERTSRHHSHSHSHSRSRAGSSAYMTREEYELERTRAELEGLRLQSALVKRENLRETQRDNWEDDYEHRRTKEELEEIRRLQARERSDREKEREFRHREKDYKEQLELAKAKRELEDFNREKADRHREKDMKDQSELQRAKRELDEIKRREELEENEKRIKKEIDLKKLEDERRAAEAKKRQEEAEEAAIEKYKAKEAERIVKEKAEREAAEKEYRRRLTEDLLMSGVDERDIQAIVEKKKVARQEEVKKEDRATWTRMSRKHLSIETLQVYGLAFEFDKDHPDCILIKRWVPEDEQYMLWKHTSVIRKKRGHSADGGRLLLEFESDKHHHHKHNDHLVPENFEWVRKKEKRHRSRSRSQNPPNLLMWMAGAR